MALARPALTLSQTLPIFPLSGVVLLPFGQLPLTIFEPRYLNMVDDALGAARILALVQPRIPCDELVPDDAALFDIGTAGRIIAFEDPGNGHYRITLEGLSRFRIQSEYTFDRSRGYRQVNVDFTPFTHDLNPSDQGDGPGRQRILDLLDGYFTDKGIDADWLSVTQAPYEALVSSLTMSCPFEPGEKQALLQCKSHSERAKMLISLFEMSQGGNTRTGFKH